MRRMYLILAVTVCCALTVPAIAMWRMGNEGMWPKSWPTELEPLRIHSRTIVGGPVNETIHEVAFSKREECEAAWPHLLKVKTKGAPIILRRGPDKKSGVVLNAGVRVYCPIGKPREGAALAQSVAGQAGVRERWLTSYTIELVVDGEIVDLNRVPLPADAPIIDERFKDREQQSSDHEFQMRFR